MKPKDILLQRWEAILAQKGDEPAIFNTRGQVDRTFRGIDERARGFEPKIDKFADGSVIAVQIGNHEDSPSIFIGCLRSGVVVLQLEQSISDHQRDAALKVCRVTGIIEKAGTVRLIDNERPNWRGKNPTLLKLTSGTTAAPRAIRFGSEQLLADCNQICDTMGISDVDLNFGVIPISHSYGFSNLLIPLIARGVPMVLSRERLPRAVLADLARTNATVFPGMPLFYQAFCEINDTPALPNLRLCISAGAPLSAAVAKKFFEKFKKPIHSFYGASECGGICYDREGRSDIEGFVGQPMRGVEVELVDATATSSRVRVRSAAVGDGYFPKPDEGKLGTGTFIPDDLLAREASGFKIVGRISDLINVAGKKVNPAEVETQLLRFAGVRQAVVFGRSAGAGLRNEEVVACVVAAPAVSENDLLRFCRTALSAWQVPKQIFIMDAIPTNERGKISRQDMARRFSTTGESSPLRRLGS